MTAMTAPVGSQIVARLKAMGDLVTQHLQLIVVLIQGREIC